MGGRPVNRRACLRQMALLPLVLPAGAGPGSSCTIDRGAIVRGPRDARRLALVFTADQYAEGATRILDALAERKSVASVFVTGRFARNPAFRPILDRLTREGHAVGPHSDDHLLYATWDRPPRLLVDRPTFLRDLDGNLEALRACGVDVDRFRYFLPPYEHFTPEIARWTSEAGRVLVNLTPGTRSHTDYMEDDDPKFVPAEAIVQSITNATRAEPHGLNGFLLLMHLGAGPRRTRDRLSDRFPGVLDQLIGRGYALRRVDDLLAGCTLDRG